MIYFLIGMPGSGKSTLAEKLGRELKLAQLDLDQLITAKENQSIAKIFETKGEKYFRELESSTIDTLDADLNIIVSTGGGTPCFNDNMTRMNRLGVTVYLDISIPTLVDRLLAEGLESRPLLKDRANELTEYLKDLLSRRRPYYEQAAKILTESELSNENPFAFIRS